MQIFKTLSVSLMLAATLNIADSFAQQNPPPSEKNIIDPPSNTIFIKNPAASQPATFFSTSIVLSFEIYKPTEISKIVSTLAKDPNVASCLPGKITGDFQQVSLTVKASKDKMWYAALFKKAGLATIKINNDPIVDIDKM